MFVVKSKKDALLLEQQLEKMGQELSGHDETFYLDQIKIAWQHLKDKKAIHYYQSMSVDVLSTLESGLPMNWLLTGGYKTIADLLDLSIDQLMQIDGVGYAYADKIYHAVRQVEESVRNDIHPTINPDHIESEEVTLLRAIYEKRHQLKAMEKLQQELSSFKNKINQDLQTVKQEKGFFGSLFQKKPLKEAIKQAFSDLNSPPIQENYQTIQRTFDELFGQSITDQQLVEDFTLESIAYYVEIEKIVGVDASKITDDLPTEIIESINDFPINTNGLAIEFRSYQLFGAKYALHFKRTLLGDEMGLGKTIQALGLINHLYQEDKIYSIVVCPLSLMANWSREIKKFSKIPLYIFHGRNRAQAFETWQQKGGILITTYEHTAHLNLDEETIHALVVDEAHYIKNPEARRSRNVYAISDRAEYALFMSGTPLENRVEEMKQLITQLNREVGNQLTEQLYTLEPNQFKRTIQEVYLRRNRKDVLEELPALELKEEWVAFGKEELEIYEEAVINGQLMLMRRAAWLGGEPNKSPKLDRLLDICDRAKENGHKVLVFSFFKDVLNIVHRHLGKRTLDIITGDVPNNHRQEIIDEFTESKDAFVLTSQITAGGVGLNIQAANVIILCEPQWKPSIENQAISRAYRMGQTRNVLVYRLLTEDSIDESMLEILGYKSEIFDLYARESEITDVNIMERETVEEKNMQKKILEIEKQRLKDERVEL